MQAYSGSAPDTVIAPIPIDGFPLPMKVATYFVLGGLVFGPFIVNYWLLFKRKFGEWVFLRDMRRRRGATKR